MPEAPLPPHVAFPEGPAERPCPACGGTGARLVYAVRGVPVHSCVLLERSDAARAFPTGDLRLAHCPGCGFLFNAAFDPARLDYGEDYEETQGCSATFAAWLEALARELAERVPLAGRTVVEVGCGRGDFLELLCRAADAAGVGVDPSATAGRVDLTAGRGLEFRRAEYGPEHAALDAALVVCRHTLEHLGPVAEFAALVRANLGGRRDARLFVEVPDVRRQLEEGAFWDVYYEHASYFSTGSLARLLRGAGFALEELRLSYGAQYVQALARPADGPAGGPTGGPDAPALEGEDDREALSAAVDGFRERVRASLSRWHALLEGAAARGESAVLWGSGSKATGFLTTLGADEQVLAVVDINPAKHGRFVAGSGHPIVSPDDVRLLDPAHVVVMNPIYVEEITADLRARGLAPTVHAV